MKIFKLNELFFKHKIETGIMGAAEAINVWGLAALIQYLVLIIYGNLGNFLKFGFLFSLKASLPSCASSVI